MNERAWRRGLVVRRCNDSRRSYYYSSAKIPARSQTIPKGGTRDETDKVDPYIVHSAIAGAVADFDGLRQPGYADGNIGSCDIGPCNVRAADNRA